MCKNVFLTIKDLYGDNSGILHILGGQHVDLSLLATVDASIRLYANSVAVFPYSLSIAPGVSSYFAGEACGISNITVYGILNLGVTGHTCGVQDRMYYITDVFVQTEGKILAPESDSTKKIALFGNVRHLGYIDPNIVVNPSETELG